MIKEFTYKEIDFYKINKYNGYYISKCGKILSIRQNKFKYLSLNTDKDVYRTIVLYKNQRPITLKLHRLIAKMFIINPDKQPCVNHINGIKYDNTIDNLEWCTIKQNVKHSFDKLGRKSHWYGKRNQELPQSKYVVQLDKSMDIVQIWECSKEVERQLGYSANFIRSCCNKKKHHKTAYGFIWRFKDDIKI